MSDEPSLPRSPVDGVRASDEDRERLISELNEHAVAGRLSTEELEDRAEAAYGARTTAELDALRRDLPATPAQTALATRTRRSHLTRRMVQETGGSAMAFVVCTLIWFASGASGSFWPVWILIVVVMSLARNGWALFGPAADLDSVEAHLDAGREHRLAGQQRRNERRARRHH